MNKNKLIVSLLAIICVLIGVAAITGGANYYGTFNGVGSNLAFSVTGQGGNYNYFTNEQNAEGGFGNSLTFQNVGAANQPGIHWWANNPITGAPTNYWCDIDMDAEHGGGPIGLCELTVVCSGRIAIGTGNAAIFTGPSDAAIQIGTGGIAPYMHIGANNAIQPAAGIFTNAEWSGWLSWLCSWTSNNVVLETESPGIYSRHQFTNEWSLVIAGDGLKNNPTDPDLLTWATEKFLWGTNAANTPYWGAHLTGGTQASNNGTNTLDVSSNGVAVGGGATGNSGIFAVNGGDRFTRNSTPAAASTNIPFDFTYKWNDSTPGTFTNVLLLVTNSADLTNYVEPRVITLHSGGGTLWVSSGGSNWCGWTNVVVPQLSILKVSMDSVGPGDTNKLVSLSVLPDNAFVTDPLFYPYSARANTTNFAVNTLLVALRAAGLVDPNGFCYPFLPGSTAALPNAFSSSYTITPHGTIYYTNGFKSDGATGYGDTGLNPSSATGWTQVTNVFLYTYAGTNGLTTASSIMVGANDGVIHALGTRESGGFWSSFGLNDNLSGGFLSAMTGPDWAIWRTNSTTQWAASLSIGVQSTSQTTNGTPPFNLYVGARNDIGTADQFYPAAIKFALGLTYGISNITQYQALTNAVGKYEAALGRDGLSP